MTEYDPPYTALAAQCQSHWTAGDLMYGGFLDWGPGLVQERVPWTDPPQYRARIEKAKADARMWDEEWKVKHAITADPQVLLMIFEDFRKAGL